MNYYKDPKWIAPVLLLITASINFYVAFPLTSRLNVYPLSAGILGLISAITMVYINIKKSK